MLYEHVLEAEHHKWSL